MSNIVTRPHSRHAMRFVSTEKKKRVQYDMDKRREEQGKTVIHLHEKPPTYKCSMPIDSEIDAQIVAFYNENGSKLPTKLFIPFLWPWDSHSFIIQGLPGIPWNVTNPYLRNGYLVEVKVISNDNSGGIRFE